MQRIGVLTSGGDAPGMNANLRAVVRGAAARGLEVVGVERGYQGLIDGLLRPLTARDVSGLLNRGGTILRTARCQPFMQPEGRAAAAATLAREGIDGLVVCGGDGSFAGALGLHREHGIAVVGTPGTIDNDLSGTDRTIGFDTAVQTAVEACDKIRDTADSHERIFVVEVMGRHSGHIALEVAIAAGAEAVLLPERPDFGAAEAAAALAAAAERGKRSMLMIVAEGVMCGVAAAEAMEAMVIGSRVRVTVLGHVLRGGSPSSDDRILATRTGDDAVQALLDGAHCHHIGVVSGAVTRTPFDEVLAVRKPLPPSLIRLVDTMAV